MSRRFRPTDAFVDESIRGQRYLMACVLVHARDMSKMRADVGQLAGTKTSRVHFNAELARADRFYFKRSPSCRSNRWWSSAIVVTASPSSRRGRCLAYIIAALQLRSVDRLVIESRQDDVDDGRTIHRERQQEPRLVFVHRRGTEEPLLWIPDGVAWAVGAGPRWSEILGTGVSQIIEV